MLRWLKNSFKVHEKGEYFPLIIKVALAINLFNGLYFFRSPFDFYYGYLAYLILFPIFLVRYGIPKHFGIISGILLVTALFHIYIGNNTLGSFLKVFIGLFAAYLFFYYIVFKSGVKLILLFKFYLAGSLFCAGFGLLQMIGHILGLPPGSGPLWLFGFLTAYEGRTFGIRVSAFFGEPTYYAMFLSGAAFIAVHDLIFQSKKFFFNRFSALILLVGVYFSYSSTFLAALGISALLLALNYGFIRYALFLIPISLIGLNQLIQTSDEFGSRIEGVSNLFSDAPQQEFNVFNYHGSAVILYNHFFVAKENFIRNPLFGTGIGSHPVAYEKYSLTKNIKVLGFNLNTKDANSMFNRLMSETGLFGLGIFFMLILFGYVNRKTNDQLWIISNACLVIMLINLGRQGHYFLAGFPFYVWMYYAVWKAKKTDNNKPISSLPYKSPNSQTESTAVV